MTLQSEMTIERTLATGDARNVAMDWGDAHHYSPAPRHRRRILLKLIRNIGFQDCLDAGCAQPFLIDEITRRFGVPGFGCDMSDQTMAANQKVLPKIQFRPMDLTKDRWPGGRQFDLVVCSEVLEHIPNWQQALENLLAMTRRYLLITVPSGQRRAMDRMVGHTQHFAGPELRAALEAGNCEILRLFRWGFPVHSLYKRLISSMSPDRLYDQFAATGYGFREKLLCQMLYVAFFLNVFDSGDQLIVLARKKLAASNEMTPASRA